MDAQKVVEDSGDREPLKELKKKAERHLLTSAIVAGLETGVTDPRIHRPSAYVP